jgi:hypothetical protein
VQSSGGGRAQGRAIPLSRDAIRRPSAFSLRSTSLLRELGDDLPLPAAAKATTSR